MGPDEIQSIVRQAVDKAVRDAFAAGVLEGENRMRLRLNALLNINPGAGAQELTRQPSLMDMAEAEMARVPAPSVSEGKRAPKGLTKFVLHRILLRSEGGLTLEEAQQAAVAEDSRISPKTVYNELRREPEYQIGSDRRWTLDEGFLTSGPKESRTGEALTAH